MTLRLILIRHAKSSWSDPFPDDHARVLNSRGRASAQAIGAWMQQAGYLPELMLCSDAARTKETAELLLQEMTPMPKLSLRERLYHAAAGTILATIQKETAATLGVIGHNPGIGMLAGMLARRTPDHHRFSDYPTCATTVIDFKGSNWRSVTRKSGQCVAFMVPRDLIGISAQDIDYSV